ncbi:TraB/GumN family protein [Tsuneonella sp. HG249]
MIRAVIGLLAALALSACERAAPPDLPAADPALWEIQLADGRPAGWLFGTIHALPDGAQWRTPAIDKAIVGADLLVVEVEDLSDTGKLAATFTRLSHSAEGLPPLSERVPADLRPKLGALLTKGGYREADFKAVETWAAAITLAQLADDTRADNGVDRALLRDFRARPVEELEGVEGQFAIFDRLPEEDQRDLLRAVVEEDTMTSADSAKLAKLWLKGDMDAIAREGDEGMLADPELKDAMLVQRNRAWAARIDAMLEAGRRPLVAVGAAHLAPPEGLPELLASEGYTVRRLR